jgi:transcriptional regulator with XRE-family HTH domain
MGDAIGVAASSINAYESGRAMPSVEVLLKLGQIYRVNLHWLLLGEGDIYVGELQAEDVGTLRRQLNWLLEAYREATGMSDEEAVQMATKVREAAEFVYFKRPRGRRNESE